MSSSFTSILRIGPSESHASVALLRNALLSHFETDKGDDDSRTLTIVNRYFLARILLQDIGDDAFQSNVVPKEDGVILVFDAVASNPDVPAGDFTSAAGSFDGLGMAHRKAEESDHCGELLRLCVGVSLGEKTASELRGAKYEEEYSRRVLWCLDRGYEYVEADLSKEGLARGHDERDKDGFARIVEAISGTVWSSAKMETKKQQELKESYRKEKETMETQQEPSENPYIPPDPANLGLDVAIPDDTERAEKTIVKDSELDSDCGFLEDPEDTEQEKAMKNLEGVIQEAKRIREASLSGQLSDDERRQRAADAALLMMGLMDQLDLDDESASEPEGDSSDEE